MSLKMAEVGTTTENHVSVQTTEDDDVMGAARYDPDRRGYRIFVGNLAGATSHDDLATLFSPFGPIVDVWLASNPPGFGFVVFKSATDAEKAVQDKNNTVYMGRVVKVNHARMFKERLAKPTGGGPRDHSASESSRSRSRSRSSSRPRSRSSRSWSRSSSRLSFFSRIYGTSRTRSKSASRSRSRSRSSSSSSFVTLSAAGSSPHSKSRSKSRSRSRQKSRHSRRRRHARRHDERHERGRHHRSRRRRKRRRRRERRRQRHPSLSSSLSDSSEASGEHRQHHSHHHHHSHQQHHSSASQSPVSPSRPQMPSSRRDTSSSRRSRRRGGCRHCRHCKRHSSSSSSDEDDSHHRVTSSSSSRNDVRSASRKERRHRRTWRSSKRSRRDSASSSSSSSSSSASPGASPKKLAGRTDLEEKGKVSTVSASIEDTREQPKDGPKTSTWEALPLSPQATEPPPASEEAGGDKNTTTGELSAALRADSVPCENSDRSPSRDATTVNNSAAKLTAVECESMETNSLRVDKNTDNYPQRVFKDKVKQPTDTESNFPSVSDNDVQKMLPVTSLGRTQIRFSLSRKSSALSVDTPYRIENCERNTNQDVEDSQEREAPKPTSTEECSPCEMSGVSPKPTSTEECSPCEMSGVSPKPTSTEECSPCEMSGVSPKPTSTEKCSPCEMSPKPTSTEECSPCEMSGVSPKPTSTEECSPCETSGVSGSVESQRSSLASPLTEDLMDVSENLDDIELPTDQTDKAVKILGQTTTQSKETAEVVQCSAENESENALECDSENTIDRRHQGANHSQSHSTKKKQDQECAQYQTSVKTSVARSGEQFKSSNTDATGTHKGEDPTNRDHTKDRKSARAERSASAENTAKAAKGKHLAPHSKDTSKSRHYNGSSGKHHTSNTDVKCSYTDPGENLVQKESSSRNSCERRDAEDTITHHDRKNSHHHSQSSTSRHDKRRSSHSPSTGHDKTRSNHSPSTGHDKTRSNHSPSTGHDKTRSNHSPSTVRDKTRSNHSPSTGHDKTRSNHSPSTGHDKTRSNHSPSTGHDKTRSNHSPSTGHDKTRSNHSPSTGHDKTRSNHSPSTVRDKTRSNHSPRTGRDKTRSNHSPSTGRGSAIDCHARDSATARSHNKNSDYGSPDVSPKRNDSRTNLHAASSPPSFSKRDGGHSRDGKGSRLRERKYSRPRRDRSREDRHRTHHRKHSNHDDMLKSPQSTGQDDAKQTQKAEQCGSTERHKQNELVSSRKSKDGQIKPSSRQSSENAVHTEQRRTRESPECTDDAGHKRGAEDTDQHKVDTSESAGLKKGSEHSRTSTSPRPFKQRESQKLESTNKTGVWELHESSQRAPDTDVRRKRRSESSRRVEDRDKCRSPGCSVSNERRGNRSRASPGQIDDTCKGKSRALVSPRRSEDFEQRRRHDPSRHTGRADQRRAGTHESHRPKENVLSTTESRMSPRRIHRESFSAGSIDGQSPTADGRKRSNTDRRQSERGPGMNKEHQEDVTSHRDEDEFNRIRHDTGRESGRTRHGSSRQLSPQKDKGLGATRPRRDRELERFLRANTHRRSPSLRRRYRQKSSSDEQPSTSDRKVPRVNDDENGYARSGFKADRHRNSQRSPERELTAGSKHSFSECERGQQINGRHDHRHSTERTRKRTRSKDSRSPCRSPERKARRLWRTSRNHGEDHTQHGSTSNEEVSTVKRSSTSEHTFLHTDGSENNHRPQARMVLLKSGQGDTEGSISRRVLLPTPKLTLLPAKPELLSAKFGLLPTPEPETMITNVSCTVRKSSLIGSSPCDVRSSTSSRVSHGHVNGGLLDVPLPGTPRVRSQDKQNHVDKKYKSGGESSKPAEQNQTANTSSNSHFVKSTSRHEPEPNECSAKAGSTHPEMNEQRQDRLDEKNNAKTSFDLKGTVSGDQTHEVAGDKDVAKPRVKSAILLVRKPQD